MAWDGICVVDAAGRFAGAVADVSGLVLSSIAVGDLVLGVRDEGIKFSRLPHAGRLTKAYLIIKNKFGL